MAAPAFSESEPEAPLLFLVGPTASGKSELAVELAERLEAEVCSLDSMAVYRGMDVGTAKPSAEERTRVPHHLFDLVDPRERYDASRYKADAERVAAALMSGGKRALFVGGTAFYLKILVHGLFQGPPPDLALRRAIEERAERLGAEALHTELQGRDPASAERLHPNDVRRVVRALEVLEQTGKPLSAWQTEWRGAPSRPHRIVALGLDPDSLDERIRARTRAMLAAGWIEEVRAIQAQGGFGPTARQALGYGEILDVLEGRSEEGKLAALIALRTRQFARRQRTWLKHFAGLRWLAAEAPREERLERAQSLLSASGEAIA